MNGPTYLDSNSTPEDIAKLGGGKAQGLHRLEQLGFKVPKWLVLTPSFDLGQLKSLLNNNNWSDSSLAVRSSGSVEDSKTQSYAGQFESILGAKGLDQVLEAIQRVRSSALSERVKAYSARQEQDATIQMSVILQEMVASQSAGVSFSRNPLKPLDHNSIVISSVWGLGEGLVSGELDADQFIVEDRKIQSTLAQKTHKFTYESAVCKVEVEKNLQAMPSLSESQILEIAEGTSRAEKLCGYPVDMEWAVQNGQVLWLQMRPIAYLPNLAVLEQISMSNEFSLWDNSNIVESYSGVTTPLTYSHAVRAYGLVYKQFCAFMGVPLQVIREHDQVFNSMLGHIRGRIYYNLPHWYQMLFLFPASQTSSDFMETMMGVQSKLSPEVRLLFDFMNKPVRYSLPSRLWVVIRSLFSILRVKKLNETFHSHVRSEFGYYLSLDLARESLESLYALYERMIDRLVGRWQAPIVTDTRCMIFFGLLTKLTKKWFHDPSHQTIQNDLLCGEVGIESTEPTKRLIEIAEILAPSIGQWATLDSKSAYAEFLDTKSRPEWSDARTLFAKFLPQYGYRSPNELKLEEPDLIDDPSFAISMIQGYIRSGQTSVKELESRELKIRADAEAKAKNALPYLRRLIYFWVLRRARAAIKDRESLRLVRTRSFGILKRVFRQMGNKMAEMGALENGAHVFYLTIEEIRAFQKGLHSPAAVLQISKERRAEFEAYKNTPDPPSRILIRGPLLLSTPYLQLLVHEASGVSTTPHTSLGPHELMGTPCCPGIVERPVLVARTAQEAQGISGEILVTERTDPGWVPIFPLCKGLLVERGSLLSHSAVVAREFGIPTVVGIQGGLLKRLKSGMNVKMDGSTGRVEILSQEMITEKIHE